MGQTCSSLPPTPTRGSLCSICHGSNSSNKSRVSVSLTSLEIKGWKELGGDYLSPRPREVTFQPELTHLRVKASTRNSANLFFVLTWECSSTHAMTMHFGGLGLTETTGQRVAVLELLRPAHLLLDSMDHMTALHPQRRAQGPGNLCF